MGSSPALTGEHARALRRRLGRYGRELAELLGEDRQKVVARECGETRIMGFWARFYRALEAALDRHEARVVWGPVSLTPDERLARIFALSVDPAQTPNHRSTAR